MKRSEILFEEIENYLANRLSGKDRIAFEERLSEDKWLSEEVNKHRELRDALHNEKLLSFQEKLEIASKQYLKKEVRRTKFMYYKIAAVLVVLMGIGALLWINSANNEITNYEELYAAYYRPYRVEKHLRSGDSTAQQLKNLYASKEYEAVIHSFEKDNLNAYTDIQKLYIGNSYLLLNLEQKAVYVFQQIKSSSGLYEDALWYISLSYLKVENIKNTISTLDQIISFNGRYLAKAKELKALLSE